MTRTFFSLLYWAIEVYSLLVLARILLSWLPVSPWHPAAKFVRSAVDPFLRPFRRVLPTFAGVDFSPIIALLVLREAGTIAASFAAYGVSGMSLTGLVGVLVHDVVLTLIGTFAFIVLLRALVQLFAPDPWHPLVQFTRQLSDPLLKPFASVAGSHWDLLPLIALGAYVVLFILAQLVLRMIGF